MNMVQSNELNLGVSNFPLHIVETDAYYDCCTEEYYASVIPSELSSEHFLILVGKLLASMDGQRVTADVVDWEIKRISQYGAYATVRFDVDVLGFLTLDYLSDDGEVLFTLVQKPDSEITELYKNLKVYIHENKLFVE